MDHEEAIKQMKAHCDKLMPDYKMVSARSVLNDLGYMKHEVEEVLDYIYDHGFEYCLDSKFGRVHQQYCYWGPDQLKSRLEWV